jgi:hypothetical protein
MPFFYSAVITGARKMVNDSSGASLRATDADMLEWAKEGVNESVLLRPDLFAEKGTHTCTAGAEQLLIQSRAIYLVDVFGITGGVALWECDYRSLREHRPGFRQDTAAAAQEWMRHPEDVNRKQSTRFFVYPPALAGQSLEVVWSQAPDLTGITLLNMNAVVVASTLVPLSDAYCTAYQHYVAWKHESVNDEAPNIARAEAHYKQFFALMGVNQVAPRE